MDQIVKSSDNNPRKEIVRILRAIEKPSKPFSAELFRVPEGETPQLIMHSESQALYESRNKLQYTCSFCRSQLECEYAFDGYNTNGDCLAEK